MDQLGRTMGYATIGIATAVFLVGLLVHEAPMVEMLIVAVSLAVAAIPERPSGCSYNFIGCRNSKNAEKKCANQKVAEC